MLYITEISTFGSYSSLAPGAELGLVLLYMLAKINKFSESGSFFNLERDCLFAGTPAVLIDSHLLSFASTSLLELCDSKGCLAPAFPERHDSCL